MKKDEIDKIILPTHEVWKFVFEESFETLNNETCFRHWNSTKRIETLRTAKYSGGFEVLKYLFYVWKCNLMESPNLSSPTNSLP